MKSELSSKMLHSELTHLISDVADSFIKISAVLLEMATADGNRLERFGTKVADIFEKARVSSQFAGGSKKHLTRFIPRKLRAGYQPMKI